MIDPISLMVLIGGAFTGAALTAEPELEDFSLFGHWTPQMLSMVAQLMPGSLVFDFGAGSHLVISEFAASHGAETVIAIDTTAMREPRQKNILRWRGSFSHWLDSVKRWARDTDRMRIGIASWPSNTSRPDPALFEMIDRMDYVVYLGNNFDGTACGFAALYRLLLQRPVEVVIEHPRNTLIIYGPAGERKLDPIPEEIAGLLNGSGGPIVRFVDRRSLLEFDDAYLLSIQHMPHNEARAVLETLRSEALVRMDQLLSGGR